MGSKISALVIICLFSVSVYGSPADIPEPCDHPRLVLRAGEEIAVKEAVEKGEVLSEAYSYIKDFSDNLFSEPPLERVMTGRRLLSVSRQALKRIFHLSTLYRLDGDKKYSDRAVSEMLALCRFQDWNPSHFLDVGEMTMAVSIGYDWLYDVLSDDERAEIRESILNKGLRTSEGQWFFTSNNNWNQVCNAGMVFGALAIFEDIPEEARAMISKCLDSNPISLASYSEEGCYPEGYGYWAYGTSFQIMLIAALESAFGSDLGLMDGQDRFYNSSRFISMMSTPKHNVFSYFDGGRRQNFQHIQAWMAAKTGDTSVLYPELTFLSDRGLIMNDEDRLFPMFLIAGKGIDFNAIPKPEDNYYVCSGLEPIFIYRNGWDSQTDTYLAVKGGRAADNHGHIDAGSFFFESDGVGWAVDLGSQNYNSLESQGVNLWAMDQDSQRWDVFRIGAESHNILTVKGKRPIVDTRVPIHDVWKKKSRKGCGLPMTAFYGGDLDSCYRKVYLDKKDNLHVEDYFIGGEIKQNLFWTMCTEAEARILGPAAIELRKDGKTKVLRISTKHYASPRIWPTTPRHDFDADNPGTCLVGFEIKNVLPHEKVSIIVSLVPST
ncbi:MAG: heparinase II/III family protein [Bacteroidales bacterium]|nr:heparinase II/III family protein [Bacteroidales bacterium]